MIWPEKWLLAGAVLAAPATAAASETVTYTYDTLGRLVAVSTSGGPNDGMAVATGYDRAGNRASYGVTGAGGAASGSAAAASEDAPGSLFEEPAAEAEPAPAETPDDRPASEEPAADPPGEPDR